jgi:hypothetical protein
MRMTRACIDGKIRTVNRMLGHGESPAYSTDGAVVLYGAYGDWGVRAYSGPHGGQSDPMGGLGTLRECGRFLDGMIAALRAVESRRADRCYGPTPCDSPDGCEC